MVRVPALQRSVADVGLNNNAILIHQRATDEDQIYSVTAFPPVPAAWMVGILPSLTMFESENVHCAQTVLVGDELGVEVCTVLNVLHW